MLRCPVYKLMIGFALNTHIDIGVICHLDPGAHLRPSQYATANLAIFQVEVALTFSVLGTDITLRERISSLILTHQYKPQKHCASNCQHKKPRRQPVASPVSWYLTSKEDIRTDSSTEICHHQRQSHTARPFRARSKIIRDP